MSQPLSLDVLRDTVRVLAAHGNHHGAAARALGIPRSTFRSRLDMALRAQVLHTIPTSKVAKPTPPAPASPDVQVAADRTARKHAQALGDLQQKYREAVTQIERLERDQQAMGILGGTAEVTPIAPKYGSGTSEGTVVLVASDWHVEENVGSEVGGLNVYNLDIAKQRATTFFQAGLRLTRLLQQDIRIDHMVLALLGDFVSNDIHDEFVDTNEVTPTHAIVEAQNMLISGIQFLLDHSTLTLTLPCHSGNHARTTKTTRFSSENGHSLEFLMYLHLAAFFRNEPRVRFLIAEGMHSYFPVYDQTIRFQHGHGIKFNGGVGGIYVPVAKALSQYNKARHADLDVLGHFHQLRDGGSWVCNGSLIGYNSYALAIKADFEKPRQALFLMDKRRGRTANWPIIL